MILDPRGKIMGTEQPANSTEAFERHTGYSEVKPKVRRV